MSVERHRDKSSEISRQYGKTLIGTLRRHYGASFAEGRGDDEKLSDVLGTLHESSLRQLVLDHILGDLGDICRGCA